MPDRYAVCPERKSTACSITTRSVPRLTECLNAWSRKALSKGFASRYTGGANGNGLSVKPGTGPNLFTPTGSGGLLGTGGVQGSPFTVGGAAQTAANALSNLSPSQLGQIAAGVAGAVGGATGSTSGSGGYKDDGYRPTIDRTGWSPTATATLGQDDGIGLITLPRKGQKNDGLWRYSGLLG